MKVGYKALVLAVATLLPCAVLADEPGIASAPRHRAVKRVAVRSLVRVPLLVPDCYETWHADLLRCAPRTYVPTNDVVTLNQLDAVPSRVTTPYPSLFSW
jgi:hypothetical protein